MEDPLRKAPSLDISSVILFQFWEKIYYKHDNPSFPSDSTERSGMFVGTAEHVDTNKIIYRSRIRSAGDGILHNNRIDHGPVTLPKEIVRSKHQQDLENGVLLPTIDTQDLIECTFFQDPREDGTRFRARMIEAIDKNKNGCVNDPKLIKFRCSVNNGEFEEVVAYNDIVNHIKRDDVKNGEWCFKSIIVTYAGRDRCRRITQLLGLCWGWLLVLFIR